VLNILSYQGLRPGLPKKAHPKLLDLMQRCWEADPSKRPAFPDILAELEDLLSHVQVSPEALAFASSERETLTKLDPVHS